MLYCCANAVNQYKFTDDAASTCPTPSTPTETFSHDEDGNLTQDGTYAYTWDAENRLIGVAPASSPVNDDKKLEFKYDYMNRRVEKKVYTYNSGWGSPTQVLRFVYDRWNVVLVLDGLDDNAVLTKYTWGLDLSGQRGDATASGIHGAGGIGGLLAVEETGGTYAGSYWFLYDANGNVTQLVQNTTNYPLTAHYEYDAYGNVIVANDVDSSGYVDDNPFRFSTKAFDTETGLVHYPRRAYLGRLGRWTTRDPIEEEGGLNLYIGMGNNAVGLVDPLGLDSDPWGIISDRICKAMEELRKLRGLLRAAKGREWWAIRAQMIALEKLIKMLQSVRNARCCPLIGPRWRYEDPKPGVWY